MEPYINKNAYSSNITLNNSGISSSRIEKRRNSKKQDFIDGVDYRELIKH